jgi:hypothetical protein
MLNSFPYYKKGKSQKFTGEKIVEIGLFKKNPGFWPGDFKY